MYDKAWNGYLLTKIPTRTCFVSGSRNFANDVIYQSKAALCSFSMNPGKMSRVGEVGERLVVGGGGLRRHEWPGVAAGPKLHSTVAHQKSYVATLYTLTRSC